MALLLFVWSGLEKARVHSSTIGLRLLAGWFGISRRISCSLQACRLRRPEYSKFSRSKNVIGQWERCTLARPLKLARPTEGFGFLANLIEKLVMVCRFSSARLAVCKTRTLAFSARIADLMPKRHEFWPTLAAWNTQIHEISPACNTRKVDRLAWSTSSTGL